MAVSTVLSPLDVMQYMWDAGFRYNAGLVNGLAVAYAETAGTLDPKITNQAGNTPPSTDRGLWQFNSYWHAEISDACAFDPVCATQQAYRIYKANGSFNSWSAFNNGAYKNYMPAAYATYNCFVVVQSLRTDLANTKNTLASTQAQLTQAQNSITSLQNQLADANAKIVTLSQGQEELVAKLDQAVADRQDAIVQAQTLEGTIAQMKIDNQATIDAMNADFVLKLQTIEANLNTYLKGISDQIFQGVAQV
jgi:hypothetical protein